MSTAREKIGDAVFLNDLADELVSARLKWRPVNSVHEGYAVILEELDEFWQEVKRKQSDHDPDAMRAELVQVAAMAARTAVDCGLVGNSAPIRGTSRSGGQVVTADPQGGGMSRGPVRVSGTFPKVSSALAETEELPDDACGRIDDEVTSQ